MGKNKTTRRAVSAQESVRQAALLAGYLLLTPIFALISRPTTLPMPEMWPWLAAWFAYLPFSFIRDGGMRRQTEESIPLTALETEQRAASWLRWGALLMTTFAGTKTIQEVSYFARLAADPDAPPVGSGIWNSSVSMSALLLALYGVYTVFLWKKVAASKKYRAGLVPKNTMVIGDINGDIAVPQSVSDATPSHWWTSSAQEEIPLKAGRLP